MSKLPYDALAVANYFLGLAKSKEKSLSPMKLQKLIYFAQGWHLALYDEPLINEEIQAWDYGPVISSVYHEFKKFGGGRVDELATEFDADTFEIYTPRISRNDERTISLLNKIWEVYGQYTGIQLSNLTHAKNSAWSKARENESSLRSVGIPNEMIKEDFASKIPVEA